MATGQTPMGAGDGTVEDRAGDTLMQLGWFDPRRRMLTLRLTDRQWQTVQEAITRAASQARSRTTPEELLDACLRQWLSGPQSTRPPTIRFEPCQNENPARSPTELRGWLAKFSSETLFTVAVRRPAAAGDGRRSPVRDDLYRQQSAEAVRRLIERYATRVRRVEVESIPASQWTEAIDRFGMCD